MPSVYVDTYTNLYLKVILELPHFEISHYSITKCHQQLQFDNAKFDLKKSKYVSKINMITFNIVHLFSIHSEIKGDNACMEEL